MTVDEIISALCTIRCIPKGKLPTLVTYLIGQWANNLAPAGCGTPSDVIQISGAGSGDVNGIYIRNPILPNTYNSMDDPQAKIVVTGGNATLFYGLAGFERYYSSAADFPCAWTLGPDGALNNPTGQWLASPPVAWAPANEPVTWQDSGGAHVGDLPTFLATANFPSVSSLVFGATGNLTSLTGLKYLPSLATVDCNTNALTSLDCTNCVALTTLNCSFNASLTTLTLTGCNSLTNIDCSVCGLLTSLNLSGLTSLQYVICPNCALTSIDITSSAGTMIDLECSNNAITSINVSGCVLMTDLDCGGNQLTILDITTLVSLSGLSCGSNLISSLNCSNCVLLDNLACSDNAILSLDLSACPQMGFLSCSTNGMTSLDIGPSTHYTSVDGNNNSLPTLKVDDALNKLVVNCIANAGLVDFSGGANGGPTNDCNPGSSCDTLTTAGWTVLTN